MSGTGWEPKAVAHRDVRRLFNPATLPVFPIETIREMSDAEYAVLLMDDEVGPALRITEHGEDLGLVLIPRALFKDLSRG